MRSIVAKGSTNKHGQILIRLNDVNSLSKNEWEFKVSSLVISPLLNDVESHIFELGCSLNTTECFDYTRNVFMDKNTPMCLLFVNCRKNLSQKIELSDSVCPWLKIENVKDIVEVTFFDPGTSNAVPKDMFYVTLHLWIRRK